MAEKQLPPPSPSSLQPPSSASRRDADDGGCKGDGKGGGGSSSCAADAVESIDLAKLKLANSTDEPVMPLARCSTPGCGLIEVWKRMVNRWDPETETRTRTCWRCVLAREDDVHDEAEARHWIIRASPDFKRKEKQWGEFKQAKQMVATHFPLLSTSKSKHMATMSCMSELFGELADQIVKKHKQMLFLEQKHEGYLKLLAEMKTCTDAGRVKELVKELDSFLQREPLLGFASKGSQQWEYQMASTYADDFISKAGNWMRLYYVCLANQGYGKLCLKVLPNKTWEPKSGSWLNPKGYYCICESSYKSTWGCVAEIRAPGIDGIFYARTPIPDEHIMDVRAMYHEDTLKPTSPQDLYDRVPTAAPTATALLLPIAGHTGSFQIESQAAFDAMPNFEWHQIFNMHGCEMPPKPPTKKEAKRLRAEAWAAAEATKQRR